MKKAAFAGILVLWMIPGILQAQSSKMDHLAMPVTDMEKSVAFYTQTLGLKEIENTSESNSIRMFDLGGIELHLIQTRATPEKIKNNHLALAVSDLDGMMKSFQTDSIYFENASRRPWQSGQRADGVRQIYIKDPDGHWIELNDVDRF